MAGSKVPLHTSGYTPRPAPTVPPVVPTRTHHPTPLQGAVSTNTQESVREQNRINRATRAAILAELENDLRALTLAARQARQLDDDDEPTPLVTFRNQRTTFYSRRHDSHEDTDSDTTTRRTSRERPGRESEMLRDLLPQDLRNTATTVRKSAKRASASKSSGSSTRSSSSSSSSTSSNSFRAPPPSVASSTAVSSTPATAAPPPDDNGPHGIRQIDEDDGNEHRRWYVITKGKGKIGVFGHWLRAAPYCHQINGAHHTSFSTRRQAVTAFYEAERDGVTGFL